MYAWGEAQRLELFSTLAWISALNPKASSMVPINRLAGMEQIGKNWIWLLIIGICSIALGTIALGSTVFLTIASIMLFGGILLVSSIGEAIAAFQSRAWSGFFLHGLAAAFDVIVGLLFVTHPVTAAVELTLVLAALFLVSGIFRIVAAIWLRLPNWGLSVLSGLISVGLGVALRANWPTSGLEFIGICISIDLIFRGWTLVMLAFVLKRVAQRHPHVEKDSQN
jgi:uncharacterized membrane protein HdeD (DUF308 family)